MHLCTLGGLRLEGSDFTEPLPLLLLSYLALTGKTPRGTLKALFWPHLTDVTKRSKSLSEALRRLKLVSPNLIEPGRDMLASYVSSDAAQFQMAVNGRDYERAVALYQGEFLQGLEYTRLQLGEELDGWIMQQRSRLQAHYLTALLHLAEDALFSSNRELSEAYAKRAVILSTDAELLPGTSLRHLDTLLARLGLSAERSSLRAQLQDLYSLPPEPTEGASHSDLIGRESELTRLNHSFLAGERLVTLTGLPGSGKTRLAQAFMSQYQHLFEAGHYFSLIPLKDASPEALRRKLAEALQVAPAQLLVYLRSHQQLLVLDNAELVPQLSAVIAELLSTCPRLTILLVSRDVTGLPQEQVIRLTGLTLPEPSAPLRLLRRAAAGQLLLTEAEGQGIRFQAEDAPSLAALCQLLGGLPLALKLAAAWLTALPAAQLLARLPDNLAMLSREDDFGAAFDLSVTLLPEPVQVVFRQLGVFSSSFDVETAEAVICAHPEQLRRLIDASLLEFDGQRYSLHPLVLSYLSSRYPPDDALLTRYAHHYLARLESGEAQTSAELDNLSHAWEWTATQGRAATLTNYIAPLQNFCDRLARPETGLRLFTTLAQHTTPQCLPAIDARRAWCLLRLGRYHEARSLAQAALERLPSHSSERETCLSTLGAANDSLGTFKAAATAFQQVLASVPDTSGEAATALANLAINAIKRGDYSAAKDYVTRAATIFDTQKKVAKQVWCHYIRGWLALEVADLLQARLLLNRGLETARSHHLLHWSLMCQLKLAQLHAAEGHPARGKTLCQSVLKEIHTKRLHNKTARALTTLAELELRSAQPQAALYYYAESLRHLAPTESEPLLLQNLTGLLYALQELPQPPFTAEINGFCHHRQATMVYADRQLLLNLPRQPQSQAWTQFTTGEVTTLVLSLLQDEGVLEHPPY
jgi:tetratricopeptide (TPR) repeat protein